MSSTKTGGMNLRQKAEYSTAPFCSPWTAHVGGRHKKSAAKGCGSYLAPDLRYLPPLAAIFFTIAIISLRSLSFRFGE